MDNEITEKILAMGADVCGVGAIDRFEGFPKGLSPADFFGGCKSVVAFGIAISKGVSESDAGLIYRYYKELLRSQVDMIALNAAKMLESEYDCRAVAIPCSVLYENRNEEKSDDNGMLSMEHIAVACGLGALGKNGLLINPDFGNLLTLGAVFTDLELESDIMCDNLCAKGCTLCIDSCPSGAVGGGKLNQKLCNASSSEKTKQNADAANCNKCRTVCPVKYGRNEM